MAKRKKTSKKSRKSKGRGKHRAGSRRSIGSRMWKGFGGVGTLESQYTAAKRQYHQLGEAVRRAHGK